MSIRTIANSVLLVFLGISTVALSQVAPMSPPTGIVPFGSYADRGVYQIGYAFSTLTGQIPLVSYKQPGALQPISYFIKLSNPIYTERVVCDGQDAYICFRFFDLADGKIESSAGPSSYGAQVGMSTNSADLTGVPARLWTNIGPSSCVGTNDMGYAGTQVNSWIDEAQWSALDGTGHSHRLLSAVNDWNTLYAEDGSGFRLASPASANLVADPNANSSAGYGSLIGTLADANGVGSTLHMLDPAQHIFNPGPVVADLSSNTITFPAVDPEDNGPRPTITDAVGRTGLPTIPLRFRAPNPDPDQQNFFDVSFDVSQCPAISDASQKPLYSTSMDFPGWGKALLCYTRVQYHTGVIVEKRPWDGDIKWDSNASQFRVQDNREWPDFQDYLLPQDISPDSYPTVDIPTVLIYGMEMGPCDPGPCMRTIPMLQYDLNTVGTFDALQAVVLPNGKSWKFTYEASVPFASGNGNPQYNGLTNQQYLYESTEAYGGITKIDYPDGGSAQFTNDYGMSGIDFLPTTPWAYTEAWAGLNTDLGMALHVEVATEVLYDGTKKVADNDYRTGADKLANTTTVHSFTNFSQDGSADSLYETKTDYYQGIGELGSLGTPLKEVRTQYQYDMLKPFPYALHKRAINVRPNIIETDLNGVLQSIVVNTYTPLATVAPVLCTTGTGIGVHNCDVQNECKSYGSYQLYYSVPSQVDTYDGQGTLVRSDINKPKFTDSVEYFSNNLLNIPSYTQIKDNSGGAKIDYTYDEDGKVRGLATSTSQGGIVWRTAYDDHGMPSIQTDPNQHKTRTTYQCNGAYPQDVTTGYGTDQAETSSYSYWDCTSGRLKDIKDPNGQITGYSYNSYGDLETINYPDGGHLSVDYHRYSVPSLVTTTKASSPSPDIVTTSVYDGFGRTIQKQTVTESGTIYADTIAFDSKGKVRTRWNPSKCDPLTASSCPDETTWGATTYSYDVLGRMTTQCNPDNGSGSDKCSAGSPNSPGKSYKSWLYFANTSTFTDESGNKWQQTMDALGRLLAVREPNGTSQSATMETDYQYDVLNNLTQVDQHGSSGGDIKRTFLYNSLSRLTNACNPESIRSGATCSKSGPWSETYSYYANGNLQTKTDARGVVTNYNYDALNRLVSKTYQNDLHGTLSSCYQYDSAANGVGRMGAQWTQKGACSTAPDSGALTKLVISTYDAMGRVKSEQQCVLSICSVDYPSNTTYSYDLAGNLTSYGDGRGATLFTNQYDGASRLLSISSSWNALHYPPLLFSAPSYSPAGGLTSVLYGAGLTLNRTYDPRLRVTSETDTGHTGSDTAQPGSASLAIFGSEQQR